MCGVIAIVGRRGQSAPGPAVRRGAEALAHRGPDDAGLHLDGRVGLGFRRLSIIDPTPAGHQPMTTEDGALTLVFNGEIYNFIELRGELAALGHAFRSASDTEVLLAAYRQWGEDCVQHFNGMWAFVIHDRRDGTLFGARDRLGVKPLYLWQDEAWLVLASEPNAIGATGLTTLRADPARLADSIRWDRMDHGGGTCLADIRPIGAGQRFRVDAQGRLSAEAYWSLPAEPAHVPGDDEARWVDELAALVTDAVRLRLRSDVPVGFTLSGGIDSSLLICEAAQLSGGAARLLAFSYQDARYDEREPIADTVAQTGAQLVTLRDGEIDAAGALVKAVAANGEPVHSLSALANHALFDLARRHGVKVLIGGQGADEVFCGYGGFQRDRWHTLLVSGRIGELVDDARACAATEGASVAGLLARQLHDSMRIGLSAFGAYRWARRRRVRPREDEVHALFAPDFLAGATGRSARPADMRLAAARGHALRDWPLPFYLRLEDRLSMSCSVEARLPFTDYRLVEHALRMPDSLTYAGGVNKVALRRIASRRVPASVVARTRKFGFPVGADLRAVHSLRGLCRELVARGSFRQRGIYDHAAVTALLAREPRESDLYPLFHLAQVEWWLGDLDARRTAA